MNICHVITRLIIGGAQENTVLTCRGLKERGHRVSLIAGPETGPEGSLWDEANRAACELLTVDSLRRAVHPMRDLRARNHLRSLFERIGPDVVHTHSSKAGILGRSAAVQAGVPAVVHTIHGMSFNRTQPAPTRTFYRFLERRAARHTTAFIAVADAMIEQSVRAKLAPRKRFTMIRSGMDTDRFAPNPDERAEVRSRWGVGDGEVVVGTIARLFKNKGYEEILAVMPAVVERAPNVRFVWIGDGVNRGQYESALERLGLRERVRFLGLVPPYEVATYINGFDIMLHASRWEGLPRAVVQGLLTEIPAVSYDNDGAPEVVINTETGVLVPYGHRKKLAEGIVRLAVDAAYRRTLGRRGRAFCLERFGWRRMVAEIETLYERIVGVTS